MALSREAILGVPADLPKVEVQVPEWGGSVFVRTMTGLERDAYEVSQFEAKRRNIRARMAAATTCDAGGVLLFSLADVEDLGAKSGAALDRVFDAARKLNMVSKDDVDVMEKNS